MNEDFVVKVTSDLIKINSQNPPGHTNEVVNYIKDLLSIHGIKYEIHEFEANKPNLIAKIGNGSPTLILNGHMDVVPPGDESKWIYPPFSGKIVDDKIFGRGATDMKGGLATILVSTLELSDLIEKNNGSLVFIASADEEVGGHAGMQGLVENNLIKGDAALIAEPSGYNRVSIGEKGLCQTKIVTRGLPSHGSMPILGDNAILKMYKAINLVKEGVEELNSKIVIPEDVSIAIKETANTYETIIKEKKLNLSVADIENQIKTISFNPGVIRGGTKINVVPDYCELELDMRIPPGCLCENVRNYIKNKLNNVAEIYPIDTSNANFTSLNEKIVKTALNSIEKILGKNADLHIETGATDGRYLRNIGIPTIIYGPGELFLAHAYNEYVKINDLKMALRITEDIIKEYLNLKTR
ncbi:acetylornithine deacetylase or succinyl-diaminopimelate desuccinylase [Caldisphaera lagunensis DSM 15908]|uniref:Probable succinyl-diaminopimelate desuccinylase n=1 Tax=Caldisphaera lagunensis (strain DSM 15908 / JCM 11604 / ANMR 0165 / IC-154) TaxID=1056495 RepID=L0AAG8_CALLD|nr:M20 family metallopeptidase [Caldisphaera lagunensis]AFZ70424.1 acetylornithine deacetylase or succinyl-diaminopimelate desuccinylase [Caldisphaera lagunensis DSM 15908]